MKLQETDVLYVFTSAVSMNRFENLYFILAIIPSIHIYSQELKTGNILFSYSRANKTSYLISKGVVNFVTSFLVVVLPFAVLYIFLRCTLTVDFNDNTVALLEMKGVSNSLEYVILTTTAKGLNAAFYASVSLIAVNIYNNIFVIASIPVIIHVGLNSLFYYMSVPRYLSPINVGQTLGLTGSFNSKLLYVILYFVTLSAISLIIFVIQALRKEV